MEFEETGAAEGLAFPSDFPAIRVPGVGDEEEVGAALDSPVAAVEAAEGAFFAEVGGGGEGEDRFFTSPSPSPFSAGPGPAAAF